MSDKRTFEILVGGRLYRRVTGAILADTYFSRALGNFPPWVRIQVREVRNGRAS